MGRPPFLFLGTSTVAALLIFGIVLLSTATSTGAEGRIRRWAENPRYWEYEGEPVVLIGGSDDDNLFQRPDLKEQLDELRRIGGNYIRNTMSDRPDLGHEVYAYKQIADGRYDLAQWNEEYWQRFENLLRWTAERDIIVQIELFDRFDYTDVRQPNWQRHPLNPKKNVNYTSEESGFALEYPKHPGANDQPFFFTVPDLRNNERILVIQQRYIDRTLRYSLQYGNVLYCIDNETSGAEEWGAYWADYIRTRAREQDVDVSITEMWDAWNLREEEHRRTLDHPERYDFVDVSQNNHNKGDEHWENLMWVRQYTADHPRPINHVKIYGADTGRYGATRDGAERFWRNLVGGAASARFHRPDSGIGLSDVAKQHLKSARLFLNAFKIVQATPDARHEMLRDREPNEAFATNADGKSCAVYFPDGGEVVLEAPGGEVTWQVRWLDIEAAHWEEATARKAGPSVTLQAPREGHWMCVLEEAAN